MNDIDVFSKRGLGDIRTLKIGNVPYFVGKDVTYILGYANSRKAIIDHVNDEDKVVALIPTQGGTQQLTCVNESGLYALVLSSRLKRAQKFKQWVTSDILPTLRKTGRYYIQSAEQNDTIETKGVTQNDTLDAKGVTKSDTLDTKGVTEIIEITANSSNSGDTLLAVKDRNSRCREADKYIKILEHLDDDSKMLKPMLIALATNAAAGRELIPVNVPDFIQIDCK